MTQTTIDWKSPDNLPLWRIRLLLTLEVPGQDNNEVRKGYYVCGEFRLANTSVEPALTKVLKWAYYPEPWTEPATERVEKEANNAEDLRDIMARERDPKIVKEVAQRRKEYAESFNKKNFVFGCGQCGKAQIYCKCSPEEIQEKRVKKSFEVNDDNISAED